MFCKLCNRAGHSSDSCYGVIGYPEWWGDRPRSRSTSSCGRGRGGSNRGAGKSRGSTSYVNAVGVNEPTGYAAANYVITDNDRDGVTGFSDSQWKVIKNLLNANTSKVYESEKLTGTYSFPSWIMDTGATHHLTGQLEILTDVKDIQPVGIVLADGRQRVSVKEGSVRLGPNWTLKSVYYVDGFQSNLISLCQLMDENRCVVQLADHFLVVQDRTTRTVIGVSKQKGGTFLFWSLESVTSVEVRDEKSFELWHQRMGHPSAKVVGLLPLISNVISSEILNKACDICLRAKQTRLSFPISENKTKRIFDLIHCDLWGPYRTPTHSGARYFLTIVDDYSRGVWLYLLNEKSEAPNVLKNFIAMTERQFETQV